MDPTTGRGKQLHLIQMLLLPFIPIMALIIQNVVNMVTVLESQADMQKTIEQVGKQQLSDIIQCGILQLMFASRQTSQHTIQSNMPVENGQLEILVSQE